MRSGAPQLAVASGAQAAEAKPDFSDEAIAIWMTMRPPTCLPKGVVSYALTTEGEVAMIRPLSKEEAFLTEPTDQAATRWAKLEMEFRGHEVEPQFLAVCDSMQIVEKALRTRPRVDDERKEFIELWRKWYARIMALRLIPGGLLEAVTRFEETQLEETPLENNDKELARLMVP
jgi:hypothetical protein